VSPSNFPTADRPGRVPLLGAFLVATVLLASWLGYEAVTAAGSYRQTAEAVLRDYAEISLTAFSAAVDDDLDDLLDAAFDDVDGYLRDFEGLPNPRGIISELDDAARAADCRGCAGIQNPLLLFSADLASGHVRMDSDSLSRVRVLSVADSISRLRSEIRFNGEGFFFAPAGMLTTDSVMVGYLLARDSVAGTRVMGFVVPVAALEEMFAEWFEDNRLLPAPIGGDQPNDSLLHVSVRTAGGSPVYSSPVAYPAELSVSRDLGVRNAGLVIHLAVRPDKASEVIIGGLPQSRLPLLIALLILTVGVGAAALIQFRREAHFQRLRDDFVSGVSHELRTPLAQIRMFAELQDTDRLPAPEDRKRANAVIHRESRRLSHLVENILQFSRLSYRDGPDMHREPLDLSEALGDGLDAMEPLLRERSMTLEVQSQSGIRVEGNRDALTRIVVNLVDNAAKYGPRGQTVSVQVGMEEGWATLAVEDQGPGVPPADRERIWKPYRRLERDVKARLPGTGIGLAVVHELAVVQGGSARVEEAAGGGARFVIRLPLIEVPQPEAAE